MVDSNKKMAMERDKDRISALPDPILHYILSLLGTKQVVETSFLSTRWRNLWISVPALNFDHSLWKKRNRLSKNKRNVKNNFMNFVDNVLFRHDGTNVTKFKISCSTFCDFDRFGGWMTIAAGKQVQEYHIDFVQFQAGYYESKELPGTIFCTGVTVFKFYIRSSSSDTYSLIRMPNSISSSPQLKTLLLSYVELPQGNSNGKLVLSCPLLETLVLECCIIKHLTILDISTLQLKNLAFHIYPLVETCQVKIFTPILESLRIEGSWNSNFSFGSLTSLVSAKIKNRHDLSKTRYFIRFLESISCATTIELCWILKHPNQDILDKTQISFSNLKCLKLGYIFMPYSSTILKIFKSAPYLETLLFHVYNMKESQEGFYHLNFDHLKSLDIGLFNCYKYEIILLEYLLKNAVVLEKLTIKIGTYRGKFVDRMDSLVKAFSSKVVLSITR